MTREELIEAIKYNYAQLGRLPTTSELLQYCKRSSSCIYGHFKSYEDACQEAVGISPKYFSRKPSTDNPQDVLDDMISLKSKLGHIPTWSEYLKIGKYSVITVRNFFGSFHKAKLLLGMNVSTDDWNVNSVKSEDGYWLSGFVEGEGYLSVSTLHSGGFQLSFSVSQRADRYSAIYEAARILGLGQSYISLVEIKGPGRKKKYLPAIVLSVIQLPIIAQRICPFFDRFPLRGKKYDDFRLFKTACLLMWHKTKSSGRRHYTTQERIILTRLSRMSTLIKRPNVTMKNVKMHLLNNQDV